MKSRRRVNSNVGWLLLLRVILMQRKITQNAILLATLLALVASFTFSTAHSQRPTGPLPDQLQKAVDTKQSAIKQALDGDPKNEWAGNYYSQGGPTAGTLLSWHPKVGFVVRWSTCSYGWRESANYGAAMLRDRTLALSPEWSGGGPNVYPIIKALVPVLWGEQHYFVWSDRLINFCYAVKNSSNAPEVDAFLLKDVDRDKRRTGLPNVPAEYRKYLFGKPILATISEIKPNPEPWVRELTLNVGTSDGVVPEMKFYAFAPKIYMLVEILEAGEHASRAYVITLGARSFEKTVTPRVGWKLTSRAPKDASYYFPG